jgi:hypothetical protein
MLRLLFCVSVKQVVKHVVLLCCLCCCYILFTVLR